MGLFDFLKKGKNTNKLGRFTYVELEGFPLYYGVISASGFGFENDIIEMQFPCEPKADKISEYQINYLKDIQKNWGRLSAEIKSKSNKEIMAIDIIQIPDIQGKEEYGFDVEISLRASKKDFFSVIIVDMKIIEIVFLSN